MADFLLADLRTYLKRRLGVSGVDIELENDDLDAAGQEALDIYNSKMPGRRQVALTVSPGQKKYPLTHTNITGVLECQFSRLNDAVLSVEGSPFGVPVGSASEVSDYAAQLAYREDSARVYSSDPSWTWQNEYVALPVPSRACFLYVYIPSAAAAAFPLQVSYTYAYKRDLTDSLEVGLPDIPIGHLDWFKRAALAVAKKILGHIRDKFKGIPTPDGGDLQVDGADMLAQGDAEWQQAVADLAQMQRQIPIILA